MQRAEQLKTEILDSIVEFLARSSSVGAMFAHYDVDVSKIKDVEIEFGNIPVSAKTKNKKIILNEHFLKDGSFANELHYVVHELCHWLQQHCADPHGLLERNGNKYLDKLTEIEAFCFQVKFMREFYGDARAENYVEDLLDFHGIKGKERETKRQALLLE